MKIFSYELLTSIIEAIVHIIDIPGGAMNDHSHREMRTGEAKTEAAGLPGHGGQSLEARSCCPAPWSRCLRFSCGQPGANGSQRATRKGQARSRQSLLSTRYYSEGIERDTPPRPPPPPPQNRGVRRPQNPVRRPRPTNVPADGAGARGHHAPTSLHKKRRELRPRGRRTKRKQGTIAKNGLSQTLVDFAREARRPPPQRATQIDRSRCPNTRTTCLSRAGTEWSGGDGERGDRANPG